MASMWLTPEISCSISFDRTLSSLIGERECQSSRRWEPAKSHRQIFRERYSSGSTRVTRVLQYASARCCLRLKRLHNTVDESLKIAGRKECNLNKLSFFCFFKKHPVNSIQWIQQKSTGWQSASLNLNCLIEIVGFSLKAYSKSVRHSLPKCWLSDCGSFSTRLQKAHVENSLHERSGVNLRHRWRPSSRRWATATVAFCFRLESSSVFKTQFKQFCNSLSFRILAAASGARSRVSPFCVF